LLRNSSGVRGSRGKRSSALDGAPGPAIVISASSEASPIAEIDGQHFRSRYRCFRVRTREH